MPKSQVRSSILCDNVVVKENANIRRYKEMCRKSLHCIFDV